MIKVEVSWSIFFVLPSISFMNIQYSQGSRGNVKNNKCNMNFRTHLHEAPASKIVMLSH